MLRGLYCLGLCGLLSIAVCEAAPRAKAKAKAEEREKAGAEATIKSIEQLGGRVERLNADPAQPVVAVILSGVRVLPAQIKLLTDFPELHTLILRDGPFDNAGLGHLAVLGNLQALDLENTAVNDAGLPALRKLPKIKEVYLTGSGVTQAAVVALRKQMPETQIYWLPPLPKLTTATDYFKLGEQLNTQHERVQAIRAYTAAMQLDPKMSAAYLSRGWTLLKEDEHALAKADFENFAKLQPQSAVGLGGLALAQYLMGELDKATLTAQKALKLDKNCADALYVRGMVKYDSQDFEDALPDFERAVKLEPADAANHERLGWTYFEMKDLEKAIVEFNAALKLDPNFEHAYYGRGLYWMSVRQPLKAIDDLAKAYQIDPTFPDYAVDLALAYATKGDWKSAVATQEKVLTIASAEDQPAQQKRLKLYRSRQLPAGQGEVESAAKPGAVKK